MQSENLLAATVTLISLSFMGNQIIRFCVTWTSYLSLPRQLFKQGIKIIKFGVLNDYPAAPIPVFDVNP